MPSKPDTRRPCLLCGENLPYPAPRSGYHRACRQFKDVLTHGLKANQYKIAYDEYKRSLGCKICGYNKCGAALEFHHRDPELKTAQIGRYLWVIHTPEALAEIAKCDLLCSNCHREHHWPTDRAPKRLSVYLAAQFARKDEIAEKRVELERYGVVVTSQWTGELLAATAALYDNTDDLNIEISNVDVLDIDAADIVVLFTEDPTVGVKRGGRHFESGYAFGLGKELITIGPRENIFHFHPDITNFRTWKQAKNYIFSRMLDKPYDFAQQKAEDDAAVIVLSEEE
jgi:nucleoside 2-deoxyribosyltransferase